MWSKFAFLRWMKRLQAGATGRSVRPLILKPDCLEDRTVPASVVPQFSPAVIQAAQAAFDGPMAHASYDLALLFADYSAFVSGGSSGTYQTSDPILQTANDSVIVDILPASDLATTITDLVGLGFQELGAAGNELSGILPIAELEAAAQLSSLRAIAPAYAPIYSTGSVASQGVQAQQSQQIPGFLGIDGSGKTVGVISDSYNALGGAAADVASGDLPPNVDVVSDSPTGSDEGRAMLQIVHDVAPGASLAFAASGSTQAQLASSIAALAAHGANAIVDDVTFLTEPMFQDGIVAQEVNGVTSLGIAYFSAAGNNGSASYQQAFRNSGSDLASNSGAPFTVPTALSPHFFAQNFDPSGGSSLFQTVTIPPGTTNFSFQWSDPYFSAGGAGNSGAATNMDIAAFDMAGNFLNIGGFSNNVGGDPIEVFSITNPNAAPMQIQLAIGKVSGPDPTLLKYVAFGPSGGTVSIDTNATASSTIFGHANAAGAEAIGAALYSETPPFGVSPPQLESYSSRGGTPILFGPGGTLLPAAITPQSPDLVAPDGVNTTFFGQADPLGSGSFEGDGFPNFFGTSAAAPSAAGVAALLLQARPTLTPAQLDSALETTAIDMNAPGFDADSGWGLIDATAALISLNAGPYTVTFNGTANNDAMSIRRDPSGTNLEFVLGGQVQLAIPASQVARINVNGGDGNDALTIDSSNGAIDRAIAFDGGAGTDSLAVLGTSEFPDEVNLFATLGPNPVTTATSGSAPPLTFVDVETASLAPANGVVNLLGDDNNPLLNQADAFTVEGTGPDAFTAIVNGGPRIQLTGAAFLNVSGGADADSLTLSPWGSNSPAGWGVQTYYDGGSGSDGNLLTFETVSSNPVSENIVVQPASLMAGEIRATNAVDGSAIAIVSYADTDLAVNDSHTFATTTDTLTLGGTNNTEIFAVNLAAAGTFAAPMVAVSPTGTTPALYNLRSFSGFSVLGIAGNGGSDIVNFISGRPDGSVSLAVDLGLPAGGPNSTDRDLIDVFGTDDASDSFRYTQGSTASSGQIDVQQAAASGPTEIDFTNVEEAAFNGGAPGSPSSAGADRIALDGTSGSDAFVLTGTSGLAATGQIDSGPLLDFNNLGSSGSTFALNGVDGTDTFSIEQTAPWAIAGLSIDGGAGGASSVAITGTGGDDRYTYTASTETLAVEEPVGGTPVPFTFVNVGSILIDALGQVLGDRLVVTDPPPGFTPTAGSGTFPTTPPLSYRNIEFFNPIPTAVADSASTDEDAPITIDVLANDQGLSDTPLTVTIGVPPMHGTAVVVGTSVLYTPAADYNDAVGGPDSFSYTVRDAAGNSSSAQVTVSIAPVNDPPVAFFGTATTTEGSPVVIQLTGDDGDPEVQQSLTYSIVSGPAHGTITSFDAATGLLTYLPAANFAGMDSFTFAVTDDGTAGGPALTSVPATIAIGITGINNAPSGNPQSLSTAEDAPLAFTLTGNDGDPEVNQTLTFAIAAPPQHGTITNFNPATGKGTYTPAPHYNGPDSFTFTVTDDDTAGGPPLTSAPAMVSLTIMPVNDAPIANPQSVAGPEDAPLPIALTGDDGDPEAAQTLTFAIASGPAHGQLTDFNPAAGTATYVPDANYNGPDSFTFTVTDDDTAGGPARTSLPATVSITLAPVNDPPIAAPQSLTASEGTSLPVALSADDGDPEVSQTLTYAIAVGPQHGTITSFNPATGQATYLPDANYVGPDSFTFTATDDNTAGGPALTSSPAAVSISVLPINHPPIAFAQSVSLQANGSMAITLTGDDGDSDKVQTLSFAIAAQPTHGVLTLQSTTNDSATYLYKPTRGFTGFDNFTFTTADDGTPPATSAPAAVSIHVTRPPDGIIATGAGSGGGPQVEVFDARTGVLEHSFFAYDPSFRGGVRVAVGDVDGDGIPDIITAAGAGGAPHIEVFSGKDLSLIASFFAYDPTFLGGVSIAAGDINGDGRDEIVVGAGPGGGPQVRTFQIVNGQVQQMAGPLGNFFAYESAFRGGVNVAAGNYDGLPGDEIITGAASDGGPHVEVFAASGQVLASFFAFPDSRLGVTVAAADLDGDGKDEIITGPGLGGGPQVNVFAGGTAAPVNQFFAFDSTFRGGINVGSTDVNGDGIPDILAAPAQSARSVQVYDGITLDLIDEFDAYASDFPGGVYIAGL